VLAVPPKVIQPLSRTAKRLAGHAGAEEGNGSPGRNRKSS